MTPVAWVCLAWAAFSSFLAVLLLGAVLQDRKERGLIEKQRIREAMHLGQMEARLQLDCRGETEEPE